MNARPAIRTSSVLLVLLKLIANHNRGMLLSGTSRHSEWRRGPAESGPLTLFRWFVNL
jgi:hypothetical protein